MRRRSNSRVWVYQRPASRSGRIAPSRAPAPVGLPGMPSPIWTRCCPIADAEAATRAQVSDSNPDAGVLGRGAHGRVETAPRWATRPCGKLRTPSFPSGCPFARRDAFDRQTTARARLETARRGAGFRDDRRLASGTWTARLGVVLERGECNEPLPRTHHDGHRRRFRQLRCLCREGVRCRQRRLPLRSHATVLRVECSA